MVKKTVIAWILGTILTNSLNAAPNSSKAATNPPKTWECSFQFDINAKGISILGMGTGQSFNGNGKFTCRHGDLFDRSQTPELVVVSSEQQISEIEERVEKDNNLNLEVLIPVNIAAISSLDLGFGYFQLNGFSKQWSSVDKLDSVLGVYTVSAFAGSFVLGTGCFTALKNDSQGLAFQIGIGATRGIGFRYGLSQIELTLQN